MSGMRWRLCAVRCEGPDQAGRLVTAEVVPLGLAGLLRVADATGGQGTLDGAVNLAQGVEDTPEVRAALGLRPRPEFKRGRDKAHTGVAGVME